MLIFERKMSEMIKNVKFRKVQCDFQRQMTSDLKNIVHKSDSVIVAADKSNNYYKMKRDSYITLLENNITKTYKKASDNDLTSILSEAKSIAKSLNLDDRINTTAKLYLRQG